ncbi:hypothetical protein BDF21DRAFT_376460 [Thamnidium elegans]|nr:hypothetical protein BDF21DRAFT_376460 [Thamnidium elegans]
MFVGDRGYGIGSTIKGHARQGGLWKPKKHSLYSSVCITNEHNSSQTCIFCFKKLFHPISTTTTNSRTKKKSVDGAFVCYNEECVAVKSGKATHGRDALSSLTIGLSGLAMLLFGVTFPVFSSKASQFNTEQFNNKTVAFLKRSATQPTADGEQYFTAAMHTYK